MSLWTSLLVAFAAARVAIPLAALGDRGSALPGLPRYDYEATPGDAHAYYSAARELMAAFQRLGPALLIALALGLAVCAVLLARAWRRRPEARHWALAAAAAAASLALSLVVLQMHETGAPALGWPLAWALPMLPYRALGFPLDPDIAFGFGLAVSLAANVVSIVAIAFGAAAATGRRAVGLLAAGLFALWPLLSGLVAGSQSWENGTWRVDAGLHMYSEPVSTALVTTGMALVLARQPSPVRLAAAGTALGAATTVRLSNGLLAALVLLVLAGRLGARQVLPCLAGALAFAPVALAYWPKGYPSLLGNPNVFPEAPFSLHYVVPNWTESIFLSVRSAAVLVPLAVLGALALRARWTLLPLALWALVNPVLYSFYFVTRITPRFLFASLPAVLILWSAGVLSLAAATSARAYGARSKAKET